MNHMITYFEQLCARKPIYLAVLMALLVVCLFQHSDVISWRVPDNSTALGYEYSDDAAIYMPSFMRYADQPLPDSYEQEYVSQALMLPGYRALYGMIAKFSPPDRFSYTLAYTLYVLFLICLGTILWKLAGPITALLGVSLALSTDFFLFFNLLGGTSRAFAPPLFLLALAAITFARPYVLLAVAAFAALFYPLVTIVAGTSAFLWFMVIPKQYRGATVTEWSKTKAFTLLAITALFTIASALPIVLSGKDYGERITQSTMHEYPETMEGGRYGFPGDALPNQLFGIQTLVYSYYYTLMGPGDSFTPLTLNGESLAYAIVFLGFACFFVILISALLLIKSKDPRYTRFFLFFGTFLLMHIVSYIVVPYLYIPGRYLVYGMSLLVICFLPIALHHLYSLKFTRHHTAMLITTALFFVFIARQGNMVTQWVNVIDEKTAPIYEQIAALPPDALIAGWPGDQTLPRYDIFMDAIPMVSKRNVLLGVKRHQVMHSEFILEMRGRMDSIAAAYTSPTLDALLALKRDYGVTHFLVDTAYFEGGEPKYFEPWKTRLEDGSIQFTKDAAAYKLTQSNDGVIFRHNQYYLIDLNKLPKHLE